MRLVDVRAAGNTTDKDVSRSPVNMFRCSAPRRKSLMRTLRWDLPTKTPWGRWRADSAAAHPGKSRRCVRCGKHGRQGHSEAVGERVLLLRILESTHLRGYHRAVGKPVLLLRSVVRGADAIAASSTTGKDISRPLRSMFCCCVSSRALATVLCWCGSCSESLRRLLRPTLPARTSRGHWRACSAAAAHADQTH